MEENIHVCIKSTFDSHSHSFCTNSWTPSFYAHDSVAWVWIHKYLGKVWAVLSSTQSFKALRSWSAHSGIALRFEERSRIGTPLAKDRRSIWSAGQNFALLFPIPFAGNFTSFLSIGFTYIVGKWITFTFVRRLSHTVFVSLLQVFPFLVLWRELEPQQVLDIP